MGLHFCISRNLNFLLGSAEKTLTLEHCKDWTRLVVDQKMRPHSEIWLKILTIQVNLFLRYTLLLKKGSKVGEHFFVIRLCRDFMLV